jgi:hypothetical protein
MKQIARLLAISPVYEPSFSTTRFMTSRRLWDLITRTIATGNAQANESCIRSKLDTKDSNSFLLMHQRIVIASLKPASLSNWVAPLLDSLFEAATFWHDGWWPFIRAKSSSWKLCSTTLWKMLLRFDSIERIFDFGQSIEHGNGFFPNRQRRAMQRRG